jgi:hypothetical protein
MSPVARKWLKGILLALAVLVTVQTLKGVVREWSASSTPAKPEQTACEDGSDREVRLCPVGVGGSKPLKPDASVRTGMRLCTEPEGAVRAERWVEKDPRDGKKRSFFRFYPHGSTFVVVRYKFKESCEGPL